MTNKLSLELHEFLDRFEILYPDNQNLSDLRRTVVDHDLSSIFRISEENEELRKAVIEENLHSLFRVMESSTFFEADDVYAYFDKVRKAVVNKNLRYILMLLKNDDLRKLVVEENHWKLWPILEKYVTTQFTAAFKNFFVNNTEIDPDCFSRGQLESKLWLVNKLQELEVELGTVYLCAGWYATLATMIFESGIKVDKIRSFDIDPDCVSRAEVFNKPWFVDQWRFKAITDDIHNINFEEHQWQYWSNANNRMSRPITDHPDTVINTSCEHIENFGDWYARIPEGKLVVLQSNDYFEIDEHVNCVNSIREFKEMAPMSTLLYMGMRELPKYTRFMLIGYR